MSHGRSRRYDRYRGRLGLCLRVFFLIPRKMVRGLLVLFRHVPSIGGIGVRYCCVKRLCRSCGDNVAVFPGVYLTYLGNCSFGSDVSIHENCNIGCMGGLTVGNDVMISQGVSILTTEHDYQQTDVPMKRAPVVLKPVLIGSDVWIGAHAVLTAGVTIGEGAVVGAGAVVVRDVPANQIVGGVPAQIIGARFMLTDPRARG